MAFYIPKLGETQNIPFALFDSKISAIIETAEKYTLCHTILNSETYFKGSNLNFQYWTNLFSKNVIGSFHNVWRM